MGAARAAVLTMTLPTTLLPLDAQALRTHADELRLAIMTAHARAAGGHLGSPLSIVDVLTVLFYRYFSWPDPAERWRGDRFVLSKGHGVLALYCLLARLGHISVERMATYGENGSALEPHPNERREPTMHASTGSLGQGLSIGVGLAMGSRLQGERDRTYVLVGDGEANEGQIWEAARCAAVQRLGNLIVILDDNGMQQDGPMTDVVPVGDLAASWAEMGWQCVEANGHDCGSLDEAFATLRDSSVDAPKLLWAHTVKGRGVPFLEGETDSHYPPPLSADDLAMIRYLLRDGHERF